MCSGSATVDPELSRIEDLDGAGAHEALGIDEQPIDLDPDVAHAQGRAVAALELADGRGLRFDAHAVGRAIRERVRREREGG